MRIRHVGCPSVELRLAKMGTLEPDGVEEVLPTGSKQKLIAEVF